MVWDGWSQAGERRPETGDWRLEAGGWRLEAGGWRLEAGGSYGRIYASTQAAASGTSDEQQEEPASSGVEKRYALPLGNRAKQSQLGGQQAGGRRLEAGGMLRRASRLCREQRATRYGLPAWAIVRNKANWGGGRLETGGGRLRWTHLHFYTSRPRRHEIRDTRGACFERSREEIRGLPLGHRAKQSQFRRLRAANGGPGGYNGVIVGVWTGNG